LSSLAHLLLAADSLLFEVVAERLGVGFWCLLQVQLQLLTATVKLFLKTPTDNVQRMIQLVLSCATNETDNPDLRDRAYVYWRLLSTDPEVRPRLGLRWCQQKLPASTNRQCQPKLNCGSI
jgi:hypothetical protein